MKTSDLKPWNWFKDENEENNKHFFPPSHKNTQDMWQNMQNQMGEMFEAMQKNMPAWSKKFIKPDINIRETEKLYEITAEIPGVDENNITLEITDHSLILKGEKKAEHEEESQKDGEFHMIERSYGSFKRILNLPDDIKPESAEASFDKGVLNIKLEREPASENRRKIKIKKQAA
ncbi:MAG: Hsp20/alpha crystallin family protein [Alphaproteobacteria bacterium]